jgi:hypothetical protein
VILAALWSSRPSSCFLSSIARPATIFRAEPFGNNALAAELAGVAEDDIAGLIEVSAQLHACRSPLEQPAEFVLPLFDWNAHEIAASSSRRSKA